MNDNDLIRRGDAIAALTNLPIFSEHLSDDDNSRAVSMIYKAQRVVAAIEPAQMTPAAALRGPTDSQVASACVSYRHDFGLLPARDREALMFEAREWLRAWQKELPTARSAVGRDEANG